MIKAIRKILLKGYKINRTFTKIAFLVLSVYIVFYQFLNFLSKTVTNEYLAYIVWPLPAITFFVFYYKTGKFVEEYHIFKGYEKYFLKELLEQTEAIIEEQESLR